jgi:hypothetical protein
MAQQFANLIQRASLPEKARGQRMPQHVGALMNGLNASMVQGTHHERGNS